MAAPHREAADHVARGHPVTDGDAVGPVGHRVDGAEALGLVDRDHEPGLDGVGTGLPDHPVDRPAGVQAQR